MGRDYLLNETEESFLILDLQPFNNLAIFSIIQLWKKHSNSLQVFDQIFLIKVISVPLGNVHIFDVHQEKTDLKEHNL